MMWKAILMMCAVGSHAYFWDIDFALHGSLSKGSTLNTQSGAYLKDSWFVPTMEELKEKLREMHRNNLTQDIAFGGSILVIGALAVLGLVQGKKRITKKPLKEENEV